MDALADPCTTSMSYIQDANGNVAMAPIAEGKNCTSSYVGLLTASDAASGVSTFNQYLVGSTAAQPFAVTTMDGSAGTVTVC